ncbi:hypothetical protein CNMCM5878_008789 [Aspergillus fumigatiaffinis]|nr:hypothetical protein CNMCM5878_008789 [Aspergillus fumigatiaffinis]
MKILSPYEVATRPEYLGIASPSAKATSYPVNASHKPELTFQDLLSMAASLQDLTVSDVAGIIAAAIAIVQVFNPVALPVILLGFLKSSTATLSAVTWSVLARELHSSYWPTILRTDTSATSDVYRPVVVISWLRTGAKILAAVAAVVTPLGLYQDVVPQSPESAQFHYIKDKSLFGEATPPRDANFRFSRTCGGWAPVACPNSYANITTTGNDTTWTVIGDWYDTHVPQYVIDSLQSGLSLMEPSVSSIFDIQSRYLTWSQLDQGGHMVPVDNNSARPVSLFRPISSLIAEGDIQLAEGLVIDLQEGGIGFRNHSAPPWQPYGSKWTEDLLFVQPETQCVDLNITIDYDVAEGYSNGEGGYQNLVLTDRVLCGRSTKFDYANISNLATGCGLVYGVPQRQTPGNPLLFEDPGSYWSIPLYSCTTGIKASIKTVSFKFNGTDDLSGLKVTNITPKAYHNDSSKPLWGVENTGLNLRDAFPLWGLVLPETASQLNLSTLRQEHLWLPGSGELGTFSTLPNGDNLPGMGFYKDVLAGTYDVPGGVHSFDYSGATNYALLKRWGQLSRTAGGTAQILNLVWTDLAANYVLGTRGLTTPSSGDTSIPEISVTFYGSRVRYHVVYGIPAFILLGLTAFVCIFTVGSILVQGSGPQRMRSFLSETSPGRIFTSLDSDSAVFAISPKPSARWIQEEGKRVITVKEQEDEQPTQQKDDAPSQQDRLSDETKYNLLAGAGISEISTQCIYRSESSLGDDVSLFQNEDVDQLTMTALMWNMGRPIRDRRNWMEAEKLPDRTWVGELDGFGNRDTVEILIVTVMFIDGDTG